MTQRWDRRHLEEDQDGAFAGSLTLPRIKHKCHPQRMDPHLHGNKLAAFIIVKAKARTHCSTSHQERKPLQHQQYATSSQQEDGGYAPGTEVMNKCYAGGGCA